MEQLWGPSIPWKGTFEETISSYKGPIFQTTLGESNSYSIPKLGNYSEKRIAEINEIFFHAPFTVNLAKTGNVSKGILQSLLQKASPLPNVGVVAHIGRGSLETTIENVNLLNYENTVLFLENSAGQKNELGSSLEELEELFENISKKVKFCLDTQHAFASGLTRWSDRDEVEDFFDSLPRILSRRLKLFHLNDSKTAFNSHVDRHADLFEGEIWSKNTEGLQTILEISLDNQIPIILETPNKDLKRLFRFAKDLTAYA